MTDTPKSILNHVLTCFLQQETQKLTTDQIQLLEKQGNISTNWNRLLFVSEAQISNELLIITLSRMNKKLQILWRCCVEYS